MSRILRPAYFFVIAAIVISCVSSTEDAKHAYDVDVLIGKASPIMLQPDSTTVNLEDYVLGYKTIDSITVSEGLTTVLDGKKLYLKGNISQHLGNLALWKAGQHYDILLKKSNKFQRTFEYNHEASSVKIKGEFNAWNPESTVMNKTDNGFSTTVSLNPGAYQYLFVVDGLETRDPNNPDSVSNGMGGWNSIIKLPRADKKKLPMLSTKEFSPLTITLSSSNPANGVMAYWENFQISNMLIGDKTIEIQIPPYAKDINRSFIRVWAYNDEGISNDVLIPLENGAVLDDPEMITRSDKEANILYFMMIDRFKNGNTSNDEPVDDPTIHPKANYYGGDLKGITQKIDDGYFTNLGITTIWLSPITQNPKGAYGKYPNPETRFSGYHGYWPISSTKIDYRYGTDAELRELLAKAHKRGMNVILDYVANHVHQEHPLYKEHPDWATPLYLPDGRENTQLWDEQRLTTWFDTFMPTLDLSRPDVVDPMTDSALYWLKNYEFDGFRHDATKHIPLLFWRELTKKTKEQIILPQNKTIFQIGETYGSRELINSYINTGMLDAQFDFNVYDDAVQTFANPETSFERLENSINESINYYGYHNLMGYITGNQDRARFISYADGSLSFSEDAKLAGWTREITIQDTLAYNKLSMLTAFMMSIPGLPVIYYGDEFGSWGGNDPDNRKMMRFDNLNKFEKHTREFAKKLIKARKENLALTYGDFEVARADENIMIIKRKYFDNEILVVFNKSDETQKVKVPLNYKKGATTLFGLPMTTDELTIPGNTFEYIKQ